MARLTAEKKALIAEKANLAGRALAEEMEDRPLELLGSWDFYGACGDDLTEEQYEDAIKQAKARCLEHLKRLWDL